MKKLSFIFLIATVCFALAQTNDTYAQFNSSDMLSVVVPVIPPPLCGSKDADDAKDKTPAGVTPVSSTIDVGENPTVEVDPETGATITTSQDGNTTVIVSADGSTTTSKVIDPKTGSVTETTTVVTDNGDGSVTVKETVVVDGEVKSETSDTKNKQ